MVLAKTGFYTFEVANMTKHQIAKFVKEKFGVDVESVNTINIKGKRRLQRKRRGFYETSGIRKAIVKVGKGQKIDLFETAEPEVADTGGDAEVQTVEGEKIASVKEKKSLLGGTKVKVERADAPKKTRQQAGKTKGEK